VAAIDEWDKAWDKNNGRIRDYDAAKWSRFGPDPDWDARMRFWQRERDIASRNGDSTKAAECARKYFRVGELKEGWIKWSQTHNPVLSGRPRPRPGPRTQDIIQSIHAARTMITVQRPAPTYAAPPPPPEKPHRHRTPWKLWWDGVKGIWNRIFGGGD